MPSTPYFYRLRASNSRGDSDASNLGSATTPGPPRIVNPSSNLTLLQGTSTAFFVIAGGTLPLSYQWRFNGIDLPGKTNPSLTITNIQPVDAGEFTVRVTNVLGQTTSVVATLTVVAPPNLTIADLGSGALQFRFLGIPGLTSAIQFTDSLSPVQWQPLATVAGDSSGIYVWVDVPPAGTNSRFYRSVSP